MILSARFALAMGLLVPAVPRHIGVAVSGGSDSMALMQLMAIWGHEVGCKVSVATVDHGLRPEAADEARTVGRHADEMGLEHTTLQWSGWNRQGNLQDAARKARRDLMAQWAGAVGIHHICLGHTLDDQAETVLMRLARGSGVDGLAGMAPATDSHGRLWLRPLLAERRQALREHLTANGLSWINDPSNENDRFDRVKAREALAILQPLGLTAERLGQTADHMMSARLALRMATQDVARRAARTVAGDIVLDLEQWRNSPREVQTRLLSCALGWVSGQAYKPRFRALTEVMALADAGQDSTLQGCRLLVRGDTLHICREWNAVKDVMGDLSSVWDGRWRVSGPTQTGLRVAALGEAGLQLCTEWRDSGLPRPSLLASPAIWCGDQLVAAPLANFGPEWSMKLISGRDDFNLWVLSH